MICFKNKQFRNINVLIININPNIPVSTKKYTVRDADYIDGILKSIK